MDDNINEKSSKINIDKLKNIKIPKIGFFKGLMLFIVLLLILGVVVLLSPMLLIGYVFHSYFNFKKELTIIKQKHIRALKTNF